jgi:ABC-type phosphate transport system auxiliary subunit
MTTSDQSLEPAQDPIGDGEVIKDLEQRGVRGIDSLSLEELQLLTERKRRQLHLETTEKKARLEAEISSIEQQIQQLGARKVALTEELNAVMKSLGLPTSGGERPARRNPRKAQKEAATPVAPTSET